MIAADGTMFINNKAARGGAIAAQDRANVTLQEDVVFYNNVATRGAGGAVALRGGPLLTVRNGVNFTMNRAKSAGGAIQATLASKVGLWVIVVCNHQNMPAA